MNTSTVQPGQCGHSRDWHKVTAFQRCPLFLGFVFSMGMKTARSTKLCKNCQRFNWTPARSHAYAIEQLKTESTVRSPQLCATENVVQHA